VSSELELRRGWVGEELAAEFPELGLVHVTVPARMGRSPAAVRERLKAMSDRFTGPKAVQVRQQPVPWAYRVFYRQIGIDPDRQPPAPEAVALERMRAGHFKSRNLLDDAMLIGTVDPTRSVLAVRTYLRAYFDRFVRGHDSHLLDGPSPAFPEIEFLA